MLFLEKSKYYGGLPIFKLRILLAAVLVILGLAPLENANAAAPSKPSSVAVQVAGNGYLQISFATSSGSPTNYLYSTDSGITWTAPSPAITTSPLTIHGLTNGTKYKVSLKAINSSGEMSAPSAAIEGTPTADHTQISGGFAYLMGSYIEIGVRPNGAFGSTSTPSGFHGSSSLLGFRADRNKDGWGQTTDDGDFFTPGSPYEGWTLKVDSGSYKSNDHNNGSVSSGSCNTAAGVTGCLSAIQQTGGSQAVTWSSSSDIDSISVTMVYSVPDGGQSLHMDVTLRNNAVSGSAKTVYFGRGVDPDNDTAGSGTMSCGGVGGKSYGVFNSCQTVVSQGSDTSVAVVKGEWGNGALIALRSSDKDARVVRKTSGFANDNPQTWWDAGNTQASSGSYLGNIGSTFADSGIFLAVKKSISAGSSVTFRVSYVLTLDEAAAPTVSTVAATGVGATTSAVLNSLVNANDATTTVEFEYGINSDLSGATNVVAGTVTGSANTSIDKSISGLTPGTTYYFRVKATNSSGTSIGSILSFTPIGPPIVTTLVATNLGDTFATLTGNLNAGGGTTSSVFFTYSSNADLSSGTTVTPTPSSMTGTSDTSVTYTISGLTPGGIYYFRLTATNENTTVSGEILRFQTTPAPTSTTNSATAISSGGATLNGTVNANNVATTSLYFEYSTSPTLSTYETATTTPSSLSSNIATSVSATVSGLTTGTTYYFRIFAQNSNGSNYGEIKSFVPAAKPISTTLTADVQGPTSVVLKGTVNAKGSATTSLLFEYSSTSNFSTSATIAPTPSTASGINVTNVQATLNGLTKLTQYWYRLIAINSYGTDTATSTSFTTTDVTADSPTVVITTNASGGTVDGTSNLVVTVTFNRAVTGFTSSDLVVTGDSSTAWTKGSAIAESSSVYTITLVPNTPGSGTLNLNIAANSAFDLSSNGNSAAAQVSITVTLPSPPSILLSRTSETVTVNTVISGYTITNSGGLPNRYSITGTLPTGLSFGTSDGLITGTPTDTLTATTYTITAHNSGGTSSATYRLVVSAASSPLISISPAFETATVGTAILGYTITNSGGSISSYSISPSAPAGTSFSSITGLLTGIPTGVQSLTSYTITASGSGTSSATFSLAVNAVSNEDNSSTAVRIVYSPPTITSIEPSYGSYLGGNSVTIQGNNFYGNSVVVIGNSFATMMMISNTKLIAKVPAGNVGTTTLRVSSPGGEASTSYTYVTEPIINSITPSIGPTSGGTQVSIEGNHLSNASLLISGSSISASTNTNTLIVFTMPAGNMGVNQITINTRGGSANIPFTYIAPPEIEIVTPDKGSEFGRNNVNIFGRYLSNATISISGLDPIRSTEISDTHISFVTPERSPGKTTLLVKTIGGSTTFEFLYVAGPIVRDLLPPRGSSVGGNYVTLTGDHLLGTELIIGETPVALSLVTDTAITFLMPKGETGPITVTATTAGGSASTSYQYLEPTSTQSTAVIFSKLLKPGKVGQKYSDKFAADNIDKFSLKSGALPQGLILEEKSGEIFGNPIKAGTFDFVIEGSGENQSTSMKFSITVSPIIVSLEVYFRLASTKLSKSELERVKEFVNQINGHGFNSNDIKITVKGYTQPTPINPDSKRVSLERAEELAGKLKTFGLAGKFQIQGMGEANSNHPKSRYAEVIVEIG